MHCQFTESLAGPQPPAPFFVDRPPFCATAGAVRDSAGYGGGPARDPGGCEGWALPASGQANGGGGGGGGIGGWGLPAGSDGGGKEVVVGGWVGQGDWRGGGAGGNELGGGGGASKGDGGGVGVGVGGVGLEDLVRRLWEIG